MSLPTDEFVYFAAWAIGSALIAAVFVGIGPLLAVLIALVLVKPFFDSLS